MHALYALVVAALLASTASAQSCTRGAAGTLAVPGCAANFTFSPRYVPTQFTPSCDVFYPASPSVGSDCTFPGTALLPFSVEDSPGRPTRVSRITVYGTFQPGGTIPIITSITMDTSGGSTMTSSVGDMVFSASLSLDEGERITLVEMKQGFLRELSSLTIQTSFGKQLQTPPSPATFPSTQTATLASGGLGSGVLVGAIATGASRPGRITAMTFMFLDGPAVLAPAPPPPPPKPPSPGGLAGVGANIPPPPPRSPPPTRSPPPPRPPPRPNAPPYSSSYSSAPLPNPNLGLILGLTLGLGVPAIVFGVLGTCVICTCLEARKRARGTDTESALPMGTARSCSFSGPDVVVPPPAAPQRASSFTEACHDCGATKKQPPPARSGFSNARPGTGGGSSSSSSGPSVSINVDHVTISAFAVQMGPGGTKRYTATSSSTTTTFPQPTKPHKSAAAPAEPEEEEHHTSCNEPSHAQSGGGTCCICMEAEANTVFLPCGHLCTCDSCAKTVAPTRRCPICRNVSRTQQRVYKV